MFFYNKKEAAEIKYFLVSFFEKKEATEKIYRGFINLKNNSGIKKTILIGHRGARSYALENTIESIKKAIALKTDMIEIDVRLTKDKVPILMHDKKVNRTTDGKGRVSKLTLKQIKKLNNGGERVPTLDQVLKTFKDTKFNLDVKEYEAALPILKLIYKYKAENRILISSFRLRVLELINRFNPQIRIAYLYNLPFCCPIKAAKRLKLEAIHPHYLLVTKRLVRKAHEINVRINPYGAKSLESVENLINKGVDGIIIDDPKLLKNGK